VSGRNLKQWLALAVILTIPGMIAKAKGVPREPIVVTISVHDDAGVPWETIKAAENEASRIFLDAGIVVDWRNCHAVVERSEEAEERRNCVEAIFPEHLHVRVVKRPIGLSLNVLGTSFLSEDGSGCQADVFYERVEVLQANSNASLAAVLGLVVVHEIGHLLLGTHSHAPMGIMRAVWGHDELHSAERGALIFTEEQSKQMREKLASAQAITKDETRASDRLLGD